MALFGEKYGSEVRVVSVPGFSVELCGGTHVHATGDIGPFKIISDSALAAGVRRLEAITADDAVARFQADEKVLKQPTESLQSQPGEVPAQVDKLQEQVRNYKRENEALKMRLAMGTSESKPDEVREVGGIRVLSRRVSDLGVDAMRQLADSLSRKIKPGVVVLGQASDGKASLVVRVTDDLTGKLNAGQIGREVSAVVGGTGGGKADKETGARTKAGNLQTAPA